MDEHQTEYNSTNARSRSRSRSPHNDEYKCYMIIENLPNEIRLKNSKKLILTSLGAEAPRPQEIFFNQNKTNGSSIVRFKDKDICQKAVAAIDGKLYNGIKLKAMLDIDETYKDYSWISPNNLNEKPNSSLRPPKPRVQQNPKRENRDTKGYTGNNDTYGLNVNFLKELDIHVLKSVIYVGNLPSNITAEVLKEVFGNAGVIVNTYISHGTDNVFAKIEYEHPVEAVQAISMFHNRELKGNKIKVYMDMYKNKIHPTEIKGIGPGLGPGGTPMRNITFMREIATLKETFNRELDSLRNSIEELKSILEQQPPTFNSGNTQQTPMQNFNAPVNPNTFQNNPIGNVFPNQALNPLMQQNMVPNNNMMPDHTQIPQTNQMAVMSQISGQLNHLSGLTGMSPEQLTLLIQSGGLGLNNPLSQVNQMAIGQGASSASGSNMFGQMGQTSDQMGVMPSQVPTPSPMGQMTAQTKHMTGNESPPSNTKGKTTDMLMFRNLPPSVTEKILIGKMKELGELKFAELTGNGKAIVRFQTERAATRCIELFHRSRVDGQTIEVTYF